MAREIICRCFLEIKNECPTGLEGLPKGPIPLEDLTEEQLAIVRRKLSDNMERAITDYYAAHPEEYAELEEETMLQQGDFDTGKEV